MSNDPDTDDLKINKDVSINAVKATEGYTWLGFSLSYSSDISRLIQFNFNKKKVNITKFYSWLHLNESTPFPLKLRVLYGCMFSALLYSCEAWGDLSCITNSILEIERKGIKSCLGVKQGTSNDLLYIELNKGDIKSTIMERQYNFYNKFKMLSSDEAVAKQIWQKYTSLNIDENTNLINYYTKLQADAEKADIRQRLSKVDSSDKTMDLRYKELTNLRYCKPLYSSMINDLDRITVTRWRLSSHKLFVETARYQQPKIRREDRKCSICTILEDEHHALFICQAHYFIRLKYEDFLKKSKTVNDILNPTTSEEIKLSAEYIREIEKNMEKLKMIR